MEKIEMFQRKGLIPFILAAAAAPLAYVLTSHCGSGNCGWCPGSTACWALLPVVIIGVVLVKTYKRILGNVKDQ